MKTIPLFFLVLLISASVAFAQVSGESSTSQLSQTFNGLRVTPFNVEVRRDGQIRVILRLENVTGERGKAHQIAVAGKAQYSDGLADFWKFSPTAIAELTDNTGNVYGLNGTIGLLFARTQEDWTIVNPGGSIPVTYIFSTGRGGTPGSLNFSAELRVVWLDETGRQRAGSFQIYFPSLSH